MYLALHLRAQPLLFWEEENKQLSFIFPVQQEEQEEALPSVPGEEMGARAHHALWHSVDLATWTHLTSPWARPNSARALTPQFRGLPPSKAQFKTTLAQTQVNHIHQPASSPFHHNRIPLSPHMSWKPQDLTCWRLISQSISVHTSISPTATFFSWVLLRRVYAKPCPFAQPQAMHVSPTFQTSSPHLGLETPSAELSN